MQEAGLKDAADPTSSNARGKAGVGVDGVCEDLIFEQQRALKLT